METLDENKDGGRTFYHPFFIEKGEKFEYIENDFEWMQLKGVSYIPGRKLQQKM
jgi:hypothetical protein